MKKKQIIFFALFVIAFFAVAWIGRAARDTQAHDNMAWVYDARVEAEEIAFTDFKSRSLLAGPEDQIVVFPDMALLKDMSDEGGMTYRSSLNYRSDEDFWTSDEIKASISYKPMPKSIEWLSMFSTLFTFVLICLVGVMILRTAGKGSKTAYHLVRRNELTQTLDDVAGLDVARHEIREVVDLIRSRGKIGDIGAKPPKGVLLKGPPGTGKTLLARAMAKEAGVNFMVLKASRLHDTFVGVGARRVEQAFQFARNHSPCVIFIDEIDAIGARDTNGDRAHAERTNLINTFLTNMDGLEQGKDVFIVAATNRPDMIDPAILRPGRIDRHLTIGLPNKVARQEILELHAKRLPIAADVDFSVIASSTPGMSGADLASLCNEAGIYAGRDGAKTVNRAHFALARKKLMLGETGAHTILTDQEREVCAWHEAGHAIAATLLENADPVEHATILPNGGSLGHVLQVPEDDRNMMTKSHLQDRLTILAAGRAAEKIQFGEEAVTNGAAGDIEAMTKLATAMVTQWGMGRMGMIRTKPGIDGTYPHYITEEVNAICNQAYSNARALLQENKTQLDNVAKALSEKDTLSGQEIREIVNGSNSHIVLGAA